MTNRRKTPDPGAENDAMVSRTYRDIASESVPEHLDKAVLDTAARQARPGYSRLRQWTRPAAWAAVVMLSVALILETNQAPVPGGIAPIAEPEAAYKAEGMLTKSDAGAVHGQELRAGDADLLQGAEEMARSRESGNDEPAAACDEAQRAAPESWLDCITELEESGLLEAARYERELLVEAFPGFDAR